MQVADRRARDPAAARTTVQAAWFGSSLRSVLRGAGGRLKRVRLQYASIGIAIDPLPDLGTAGPSRLSQTFIERNSACIESIDELHRYIDFCICLDAASWRKGCLCWAAPNKAEFPYIRLQSPAITRLKHEQLEPATKLPAEPEHQLVPVAKIF